MKSWYTIRARSSGTEVLIYDEIGAYGVTAKGFLAELGALPDDAAIDLRLNSPGGSVFDAVAIYNALKRHTGDITVWIDGIAASAASYIAMAGDMIVMPENAFLMIHDPSGLVMGSAEDMRSTAEALDKVKVSLIQGYTAKSGKPDEEIAALMAAETWLDATEALDLGLIDRIAEPVKLSNAGATAAVRRLVKPSQIRLSFAIASPVRSICTASVALTATPKSRTSLAASRKVAGSILRNANAALSPKRSEATAARSASGTSRARAPWIVTIRSSKGKAWRSRAERRSRSNALTADPDPEAASDSRVVSFFVACSISPSETPANSPARVRTCRLSTDVLSEAAMSACAPIMSRPERIIATPAAAAAAVIAASAIPALVAKPARRVFARSISEDSRPKPFVPAAPMPSSSART
jgi:ATP-dependent Clp endopeptidase proteolytic subunit ClpP